MLSPVSVITLCYLMPRSRRTRYTSSSRTDMMLVECFFAAAPNCIRASMAHNLRGLVGRLFGDFMARNVSKCRFEVMNLQFRRYLRVDLLQVKERSTICFWLF